jgi:GTP pyrophosphokinase
MESMDLVNRQTVFNVALRQLEDALGNGVGETGEPYLEHARGVLAILEAMRLDDESCLASVLCLGDKRAIPLADLEKTCSPAVVNLVAGVRRLLTLRALSVGDSDMVQEQTQALRKMMLAMASDVRVVLIRLASRLQTLRFYAANKGLQPWPALLSETRDVLAPLANRLGIWQLKWELEDLCFRFLEPVAYKALAQQVDEKRREREDFIGQMITQLQRLMQTNGIACKVLGRPKHLFSIAQKIRHKGKPLEALRDLRAFRIIVDTLAQCYEVLSGLQQEFSSLDDEFDDYIARPKPNGYQSLHTVLVDEQNRQFEVQIRTRDMHDFAEYGVAAHWRYKEASAGAPAGATGQASDLSYLRHLLAWQQEVGGRIEGPAYALEDDRIYVLTPQARIVELPKGATAVDFAYHVHTDLGHRCRGAKVDGALLALNQALQTGQTVEIVSARQGRDQELAGPSRDWLNPELGFVQSQRGRAKVRQWFNALDLERDLASGRNLLEKAMQREGKTNLPLEEIARRLGQANVNELFLSLQKEQIGPRVLEQALRGEELGGASEKDQDLAQELALRSGDVLLPTRVSTPTGRAPVLVVGADFLLTQLARCCRPVPPDRISGFVTRGRGVSVHRAGCAALARSLLVDPDRMLECTWGPSDGSRRYPVECALICEDRQGLLRDVSDVFARNKVNVISVRTLSQKDRASMRFTVEVPDLDTFRSTCTQLLQIKGVISAQRHG